MENPESNDFLEPTACDIDNADASPDRSVISPHDFVETLHGKGMSLQEAELLLFRSEIDERQRF